LAGLSAADLRRLFGLLNDELAGSETKGELYLVGGAVMCLAYSTRSSTEDVDGTFKPTAKVREAAARVAVSSNQPADWLNDAVKGYLSERGTFREWLELSNLKIMVAQPEYLLAMKCLAFRIGPEFHDEEDIRFLLRLLNLPTYEKALETITQFYPLQKFPQKTLYALEELMSERQNAGG
jgi:hypothetical protein